MKRKNVCLLVRNRECSDQNNRRRDFKILKSLICYVSQLPFQILKSLIGYCKSAFYSTTEVRLCKAASFTNTEVFDRLCKVSKGAKIRN